MTTVTSEHNNGVKLYVFFDFLVLAKKFLAFSCVCAPWCTDFKLLVPSRPES